MGFSSFFLGSLALFVVVYVAQGQPLVPALFIFGDSVVDVGNNNHRPTLIKADFLPYGRDFVSHKPTGRFCNGKLATDLVAENLGFTSYPPAYLSEDTKGSRLLSGANFASGSSGYDKATAFLYNAIPLMKQVEYYKEYQSKLVRIAGKFNASTIISKAIYILSAGSSDFVQNYYINPLLNNLFTPDQFSDILLQSFSTFVKNLYGLGARRIGVTTLPPLGCLPATITIYGRGSNKCVERLNRDATSFNNKLNATAKSLVASLSGLKLVVFDIYHPLYDLITKPSDNGFFEARRACCGTGTIETSVLCNRLAPGTCTNATGYVFWDSFHPTEAANQILANGLLEQGFSLIS